MNEYLIAAWLILFPFAADELPDDTALKPYMPLVVELAVSWELMDLHHDYWTAIPYDSPYAPNFQIALTTIRGRYQELKDAPHLSDAQRLPDVTAMIEWLTFNKEFQRYVDTQVVFYVPNDPRYEFWKTTASENRALYQIWDALIDGSNGHCGVHTRRMALKKARQLLGPETYEGGHWPPNVPTHRFQAVP